MTTYFAIVHKDSDSAYGVVFPDVPGCFSAGDSLDEALANAIEALRLHAEALKDDGRNLPVPRTLDEILSDPDARPDVGQLLIAVPATLVAGDRAVVDIAADAALLDAIDAAARRSGLTRADFLAEAAREKIAG